MLNTKKLLYILPDASYIAELLPAKKPNTFAIQAFRQINGNFIDENEFIAENVQKLIKKIEPEEYHLILPDFLFTNTIIDVNQTSESGVKTHLKENLLPSLDLSKDTHELDTFILTQHQGKSKVQLSALEKSLLEPIQSVIAEQKVSITNVSPLSWTIKSVISLEPSLSTIQMGGMLYLAQHYIGIDQTISFSIEETENIVETVKTLKGAEPNIQTMYLLTNALVESQIKEKLSGTLPIQQLSNFGDDQEGIPSYVKQIIEASAKTLSISEYPVPRFSLGKSSAKSASVEKVPELTPPTFVESLEDEETTQEDVSSQSLPEKEDTVSTSDLPSPSLPTPAIPAPVAPTLASATTATATSVAPAIINAPLDISDDNNDVEKKDEEKIEAIPGVTGDVPMTLSADKNSSVPTPAAVVPAPLLNEEKPVEEKLPEIPTVQAPSSVTSVAQVASPVAVSPVPVVTFSSPAALIQNMQKTPSPVTASVATQPVVSAVTPAASITTSPSTVGNVVPFSQPMNTPVQPTQPQPFATVPSATAGPINPMMNPSANGTPSAPRPVLKNKGDNGTLFKMIFLVVAALGATIAVGVGIGYGLLKMSENDSPLNQNVVVDTPSESPDTVVPDTTTTPAPSPVAEATSSGSTSTPTAKNLKVLVVNATTISGKAGRIKKTLTDAGYKSVDTGNAKGKYSESGMFIQTDTEDAAMTEQFSNDLATTVRFNKDKTTEDPKDAYDVVVVINE